MINNLFLILMISHIIADYYLQSNESSKKKNSKILPLLMHCGVYTLVVYALSAIIWSKGIALFVGIYAISHLFIDILKLALLRSADENSKKTIYIVDQLLHIVSMVVIVIVYQSMYGNPAFINIATNALANVNFSLHDALRVLLIFLIIYKPANVSFKEVFYYLKPVQAQAQSKDSQSAGAIIAI